MKKTNYLMIMDLEDWYPASHGWITNEESNKIRNTLHIDELDNLALQNLRDFVVLYFSTKEEEGKSKLWDEMDKMSAITAVIDAEKFDRDMEI